MNVRELIVRLLREDMDATIGVRVTDSEGLTINPCFPPDLANFIERSSGETPPASKWLRFNLSEADVIFTGGDSEYKDSVRDALSLAQGAYSQLEQGMSDLETALTDMSNAVE